MTCFICGKGTLIARLARVNGEIRREKFTVETNALVCDTCGHVALEGKDMPEYMRRVADAYRSAHDLLTSSDIKRIRGGMSQQHFAEALGVGVASVKRWELGLIQEKAMDELIRLKTDPAAARRNLKALELQAHGQHVLSTGVIGGQEVELSFSLGLQQYDRHIPIRMDRSEMPSIPEGAVSILAA